MASGWAWLGLDQVGGIENMLIEEPEQVAKAKLALRGWVYFQPASDAPEGFYELARNATFAATWLLPVPDINDNIAAIATSTYAANMYDAVVLYAMAYAALNATMPGGQQLAQEMRNLSFRGMTGQVELDGNLDMLEVVGVMNYATVGAHQVGACYSRLGGTLRQYEPVANRRVVWPGGSTGMPPDVLLLPQPFQLSAGAAAAIAAFSVVAGILLMYTCLTRGHIFFWRMVVPFAGGRPF